MTLGQERPLAQQDDKRRCHECYPRKGAHSHDTAQVHVGSQWQNNFACLQIASKDKDFRYMATSDLQGELAKDNFKTEGETEKKLCQAILQQLDDISGDISGMAVKWQVCLLFAEFGMQL